MQFQNLFDPAALFDNQRLQFATVVGLMQDSLGELRTAIKSQNHRQVIAASLVARFPNLASDVCALISADQGDKAIDLIGAKIKELRTEDAALFMAIPNRDEMLKLCIRWRGGLVSADQRASLWSSFCDRGEEQRMTDAYRFRKALAERGQQTVASTATATPAPSSVFKSGAIAGGPVAEGTMQDIISRERVGKISG